MSLLVFSSAVWAKELHALTRMLAGVASQASTGRVLRMLTGLEVPGPTSLGDGGLPGDAILAEAQHARGILNGKAVPILQLDSQDLEVSKGLQGFTKIAYLA
jgi:hypothetical protein